MSILRGLLKRGREEPLRPLGSDDGERLGNVNFREPELEVPNTVSFRINLFFLFVFIFVVLYSKGFEVMRSMIDWQNNLKCHSRSTRKKQPKNGKSFFGGFGKLFLI